MAWPTFLNAARWTSHALSVVLRGGVVQQRDAWLSAQVHRRAVSRRVTRQYTFLYPAGLDRLTDEKPRSTTGIGLTDKTRACAYR